MNYPRHALEIAHVLDIWTDHNTVLHRAEAFEVCEEAQRQGLRPCVLRAGGYVFPRERPIRAVDGLGIVVSVPMLLDEDTWNTFVRPRMETSPEFAPLPPPDNHGADDQVVLVARRPRLRVPSSSGSSSSSTGATTSQVVMYPLLGRLPGPERCFSALTGSRFLVTSLTFLDQGKFMRLKLLYLCLREQCQWRSVSLRGLKTLSRWSFFAFWWFKLINRDLLPFCV